MRIILKTSGWSQNVQVDPNFTVNDLKRRVHFRTGIPPDEQRFLFDNNMLQDDCSLLSDYHIQDQSILYLLRRRIVPSDWWLHSP
ncbi:ubiquitin-related domain-containing protein [Cantharellus anzutake]|uniref:ubiquitin-related domain-containing protein n=1 Tax=Cantharellus anzutake TaxID=1750568 RepID=UPI001907D64B|nr:ubiquitin-related domain-containing protein [Cantharellus anzutake]KAF8332755.1 ubiquitin-related domain-containing protein [Cantharellus anzutake]